MFFLKNLLIVEMKIYPTRILLTKYEKEKKGKENHHISHLR